LINRRGSSKIIILLMCLCFLHNANRIIGSELLLLDLSIHSSFLRVEGSKYGKHPFFWLETRTFRRTACWNTP
jgi:hypothetical protein